MAYSFNITVVPTTGLSYMTVWATGSTQPTVSTLNDSAGEIIANAAIVPAGSNGAVNVFVTDATHVIIDVNGYFVAGNNGDTNNTSFGSNALSLSAGGQNTAVGASALQNNSNGNYNTAVGSSTLISNTTGSSNTAFGEGSMLANSTGSNNTAIGFQSMPSESVATGNVAIGFQSMLGATGSGNTAIGSGSLTNTAGRNNIAIGNTAGNSLNTGNDNIDVGNAGTALDSGLIRIGTLGTQSATYIAGISGVNITGGAAVVINGAGQLGVVASSQRYKEDIHPMADASDRLLDLQPVTFRYKQASPDGSQPLQYGLIAEQVAKVYPELAVYGRDGQVETLQYQQLPAMLLNEIQKQQKMIQELQTRIATLEHELKSEAPAASH
jgi:hypothetical protein